GDVPRPDLVDDETSSSHLVGASLGIKAALPAQYVRPYVGLAAGLFGRFDSDDGEECVRPSLAVPAGIRIRAGSASLRLDARWRFDEHPDGVSGPSREFTAGLGFRYQRRRGRARPPASGQSCRGGASEYPDGEAEPVP